jgi:hypothetical protein
MEQTNLLLSDVREETRNLLMASNFVLQGSAILACQRRCLKFASAIVSDQEQECLHKCADEFVFFDTATYELDSVAIIAAQQNKPKKSFLYY